MAGRQISDRQREWLDQELTFWCGAGLVQTTQAEQIRGCYETVAVSGARKHSLARFALQGIAALLVGLAVLLVIGYNWEQLHWGAKLALIFSGVAGTHAVGFYLRDYTPARRSAEVVFFLGCLFYGAGIWLVAQVFHLDPHYPDGIWWWALGVLPFAILLDTLLLHVLFVGLLGLWAWTEVVHFPLLPPWWLWSWWPNGAYSLPLLALPGLVWAYRRESAAAVALYAPLLAWWVVLQAVAWNLEWQSLYLVGVMGGVFLIIAENHRRGSPLAVPYRAWGTLMAGGAPIPPSFYDFHRNPWGMTGTREVQAFALLVMLVVLSALVAFAFLLRPLGAQPVQKPFARMLEVLRRQWVPFGLVLVMVALAFLSFTPEEGRLPATIIANVAMICFALWLMQIGLREKRGPLFAAGVLYFLLWSIFHMPTCSAEYGGMLGAALMFFLCGAALWGLSVFWGKRKELRHA